LVDRLNPGTISNATDTQTIAVTDTQNLTTTESYLYNPYQGGLPSPEAVGLASGQPSAAQAGSADQIHPDQLVAKMINAMSSFTSTSTGLALDHSGTIAAHELSAGFMTAASHPGTTR